MNGTDHPTGLAVVDAKGQSKSLRDIVGFTNTQQEEVVEEVKALKQGQQASSSDIRVLFAAAAIVWRDRDFAAQPQLLTVMRAACVDERRNREAQLPAALSKDRATLLSDMGSSLAKALLDE